MKVHFIGIGGIGVSALARYYLAEGWQVSGSDICPSEITVALGKAGAKIYRAARTLGKTMPDIVVYSPAVKKDDPELEEARKLGIKTMSYPEALGELTKVYKTIAVAGAHGKSTTTAMIGLMMAAAKLDPMVIVGTKVKEFQNSNFLRGRSEYLVIEACEYDRSFLNYWPQVAVITNIEMDHMECYESESRLAAAFREFARHLPSTGTLVACADDKNAAKLTADAKKTGSQVMTYSVKQAEAGKLRKILKIPGEHNVANALAALAVGRLLKIPDKTIFSSLAKYNGSWRRFDIEKGKVGGKKIIVVSDYGHHPTQIKLTMEAARQKWPEKKIICVFQPHQAWRTHLLFKQFVQALKNSPVDKIFITDIYRVAGRENAAIAKKTTSRKLAQAVAKGSVEYVPSKRVPGRLKKEITGNEIVMVMGAGDIYRLSQTLTSTR